MGRLAALVAAAYVVMGPATAGAAISIQPALLDVRGDSNRSATRTIVVRNDGPRVVHLRVTPVAYEVDAQGEPRESRDRSTATWISTSPKVEIAPESVEQLVLRLTPKGLRAGTTWICAVELRPSASSSKEAVASVGLAPVVLYTIRGERPAKPAIAAFDVGAWVQSDSSTRVTITLRNDGDEPYSFAGSLRAEGGGQHAVGERYVFPHTTRTVEAEIALGTGKGRRQVRADLSTFAPVGTLRRSRTIVVIPMPLVVGSVSVLVALGVGGAMVLRCKRRRQPPRSS